MAEGLGNDAQTVRGRLAQSANNGGLAGFWIASPLDLDLVKASQAGFEAAQGLLGAFGKGPADGHDLAHRLHRGGQIGLCTGIFFEGKAGDLGDHIVDGGFERGRGRTGNVVHQLIKGVADGQTGRDLGNGKARRLGGQGRGARHAGVHLDDDHAAILGIDRELDV